MNGTWGKKVAGSFYIIFWGKVLQGARGSGQGEVSLTSMNFPKIMFGMGGFLENMWLRAIQLISPE